jgi:hypothetical protein
LIELRRVRIEIIALLLQQEDHGRAQGLDLLVSAAACGLVEVPKGVIDLL